MDLAGGLSRQNWPERRPEKRPGPQRHERQYPREVWEEVNERVHRPDLDTFMLAVQNQKNCYKSNRATTMCIKCDFGFMGRLFTYERPMILIWCSC
jgi:hypothetical protein